MFNRVWNVVMFNRVCCCLLLLLVLLFLSWLLLLLLLPWLLLFLLPWLLLFLLPWLLLLLLPWLLLLLLPWLWLLCFKDCYRTACVYGLFLDFLSFLPHGLWWTVKLYMTVTLHGLVIYLFFIYSLHYIQTLKPAIVNVCMKSLNAVSHSMGSLIPSLPWCHLKTTNKNAKCENRNCFCLIFHTVLWKNFHRDT